jgi:hypothetical protein
MKAESMAAAKPRDEELFEEALDLQSGRDRTAFLDRSCQDAPELRARLERLLKAHEGAERFFADCLPPMDFATPEDPLAYPKSRAATQSQQDPAAKPGEDQVGSQIGSYKLLRKIGEGGCGSVFLAEQESPVRRRLDQFWKHRLNQHAKRNDTLALSA